MKSRTKVTREGHPYLLLLESALLDAGLRCAVDVERDLGYVQRRFAVEGETFLHSVLPEISSFLERGLRDGWLGDLPGFSSRNAEYPAFLSGFFEQVFGPEGCLLADPNVDAILCIRQISRLFKKIELKSDDANRAKAIRQYLATDVELGFHEPQTDTLLARLYKRIGDVLWTSNLAEVDHMVREGTLVPRHGSGATAEGLNGNRKWMSWLWPARLHESFPSSEYCAPFHWGKHALAWGARRPAGLVAENRRRTWIDAGVTPWYKLGDTALEPWVRLTDVPKTVKTPRIIAVESVAMQYAQQAVMNAVYDALSGKSTWLSNHIGFRDQERNKMLARRGSAGEGFATLDLSEASDRVHLHYVGVMFEKLPALLAALMASRTSKILVDEFGFEIELNKFASMGSGTCFPVETMHFFQIVLAAICEQRQLCPDDLNERLLREVAQGVSAFGDDLIVPVAYAESVSRALEVFGLRVNTDKSFMTGRFRESCGGDYWNGYDVKPVYVRTPFPTSETEGGYVNGWIEMSNQLYMAGFWLSADITVSMISGIVGELPVLRKADEAGCLALVSYQGDRLSHLRSKWNKRWQHRVYGCWTLEAAMVKDIIGGYPALKKCLTLMANGSRIELVPHVYESTLRKGHLDETAKPYSAKLRRRWVPLGGLLSKQAAARN